MTIATRGRTDLVGTRRDACGASAASDGGGATGLTLALGVGIGCSSTLSPGGISGTRGR